MENEINYKFEGEISAQPQKVNDYQGKKNFGFKIKESEEWFNFYQDEKIDDKEFEAIMQTDFKRGFKIKFNEVQNIVTDYVITERKEAQKKGWAGGSQQDPKSMYVAYAKDIFVVLKNTDEAKEVYREGKFVMEEAIDLVKQAQKAF